MILRVVKSETREEMNVFETWRLRKKKQIASRGKTFSSYIFHPSGSNVGTSSQGSKGIWNLYKYTKSMTNLRRIPSPYPTFHSVFGRIFVGNHLMASVPDSKAKSVSPRTCCGVIEQARYEARAKQYARTAPQPWIVLKLMVGVTVGIMAYSAYVYIGRFCVGMIKHGRRSRSGSGSEGMGSECHCFCVR